MQTNVTIAINRAYKETGNYKAYQEPWKSYEIEIVNGLVI